MSDIGFFLSHYLWEVFFYQTPVMTLRRAPNFFWWKTLFLKNVSVRLAYTSIFPFDGIFEEGVIDCDQNSLHFECFEQKIPTSSLVLTSVEESHEEVFSAEFHLRAENISSKRSELKLLLARPETRKYRITFKFNVEF